MQSWVKTELKSLEMNEERSMRWIWTENVNLFGKIFTEFLILTIKSLTSSLTATEWLLNLLFHK